MQTRTHHRFPRLLAVAITLCLATATVAAQNATAPAAAAASPAARISENPEVQQVVDAVRALATAIRSGDPAAVQPLLLERPDDGATLQRNILLTNAIACRVDRAWVSRYAGVFALDGLEFHEFGAAYGGYESLLETALGSMQEDDVIIDGDQASVVLDVRRGDTTNSTAALFGKSADLVLRFARVDDAWKLDTGKTIKGTVRAAFAPNRAPADEKARQERIIAFVSGIRTALAQFADKLNAGEFAGPVAARKWIRAQALRVFDENGFTDLNYEVEPAK